MENISENYKLTIMKELSIEEKAKRYESSLERCRKLYNEAKANEYNSDIEDYETIFPELKESEDERIRKFLIEDIKDTLSSEDFRHYNPEHTKKLEEALAWLEKQGKERKITYEEICKSYDIPDIGEFSDGYHTFNGLYKQRMILFAVLVKTYKDKAWKSWKHEDGLDCFGGGWFIVGIDTPAGTYTYHYEAKDWDRFDCQILEKAKHWDGHSESDVERLFSLVSNVNKDEVVKCLINGMKFYYEDNEEATWGTQKFPMKVKDILAWLEKQGEQKPIDEIKLGKKYKCIASPRYTMFMVGEIYNPEDEFLCSLMNLCSDCFESVEDGEQKPIQTDDDRIATLLRDIGQITEEKAKRYDEALERAKKLYEQGTITESLSYVFPELKESTNERIRKGLIKAVSRTFEGNKLFGTDVTREEALAWLEKQGEKKPAWSEEDECYMAECINAIATKDGWSFEEKRKTKHWLKSLKQRIEE